MVPKVRMGLVPAIAAKITATTKGVDEGRRQKAAIRVSADAEATPTSGSPTVYERSRQRAEGHSLADSVQINHKW
jgi:hypothetical protein